MAIRIRNIDLGSLGMQRADNVSLGDVTATRAYQIFTAPLDCVVNFVDIYSNEANPPATLTASTTNMSATLVSVINGTAGTMAVRGTSATATNSDSISANVAWRLTPTAFNSLTQGAPLRLTLSIGGSGTLSAVCVRVSYTPLLHRSTR